MLYIIQTKQGHTLTPPLTLLEAEAKLTLYKNWFTGIDKKAYIEEATG